MRSWAWLVVAVTLGCRRADPPEPDSAPLPRRDQRGSSVAQLDGAVLDGRYDTTGLAELARTLPRPTPTGSPLVGVFAGLVAEFDGAVASERLAAIGVEADADLELSIRALDGRAASARKLLGELADDESAADPALLERLRGEAGTLGLHLRASVPIADRAKLLATLERVVGPEVDGAWAPVCTGLDQPAFCAGPERLLIWARPVGDASLRVDAIYLFHPSTAPSELAWIVARADGWAAPAIAPELDTSATAEFELELRALPMLRVLEAEALADAVIRFGAGELDYHAYVDQEQALRDLVPESRVFDGVRTQVVLVRRGPDELDIEPSGFVSSTTWIPVERPLVALAELFAPLSEPFDLPTIEATCEGHPVCARLAGLTLAPRFAPLGLGPFVDTTGATRVLRQAGDRGPILLMLASWPNLLGTAGRLTEAERGLMSEAQAALVDEAYAIGGAVLELDPDPSGEADQWVAYLRMGPNAFGTVRPLAGLAGLEPRPLELEGVASLVDRGEFESDGDSTRIYFVDEREQPAGKGGWLLAADTDERAAWLLTLPRESSTELEALGFLQIRELGRVAEREAVPFGADPPVRRWLDQRTLTIQLRLAADGPLVELRLQ